jgi:peptide chain release factor 2
LEKKRNRIKEIEFEFSDPDLWKNREIADAKIKETGELGELAKKFDEIEKDLDYLEDNADKPEGEEVLSRVRENLRQLETEELFKGKYDKLPAIVSVYSGAGGDDAEDWANMLFEMYRKFAEKRKWKIKDKGGRVLEIAGNYAFGYLKKEAGVHRLVRISPFSSEQKRHTSFALVEVLPELSSVKEDDFKIPEDDLKVEFFRSSGPGGQNVNKVETAVRLIHVPTGLTAASQEGRSQSQNRETAMNTLRAKLIKLMEENQVEELDKLKVKVKPEWGSQIRSYVLHPYKLVKDHRTGVETAKAEEVLDGDIELFIESEVK